MQYNKKVLVEGDIVTVVDVLRTQHDYVSDLMEYVGKSGEIISISSSGNCEVMFSCTDHHWWFAPSFLKKDDDVDNFIDTDKITPKRRVFIGKSLERLNIHSYLYDIHNDLGILCYNLPDENEYQSLYGKFGTIIDKDYIHKLEHGYEDGTDYDTYIGVLINGAKYYLPQCAVYGNYPTYESRTILKKI